MALFVQIFVREGLERRLKGIYRLNYRLCLAYKGVSTLKKIREKHARIIA